MLCAHIYRERESYRRDYTTGWPPAVYIHIDLFCVLHFTSEMKKICKSIPFFLCQCDVAVEIGVGEEEEKRSRNRVSRLVLRY